MVFSRLEKAMGIMLGLDLARPGTTRAAAKAGLGLVARAVPPVVALPGVAPAIGAGLGYAALQTPTGQGLLATAEESGRRDRVYVERQIQDALTLPAYKAKQSVKRRKTDFNKAMSVAMKQVRASTSYGAKGKINNSKKAFSAVSKVVAAVKKKKKLPKGGIKRKIALSVRRFF